MEWMTVLAVPEDEASVSVAVSAGHVCFTQDVCAGHVCTQDVSKGHVCCAHDLSDFMGS